MNLGLLILLFPIYLLFVTRKVLRLCYFDSLHFVNRTMKLTHASILVVIFIIKSCSVSAIGGDSLYTDVVPANTSDSLYRIYNVPLKVYGFKYDSVVDRKQMGILGSDAQRWFPDSVEVIPKHTIVNKENLSASNVPSLTVLKNFPMVNKQVIYMHGLAALQEMAHQYSALYAKVDELKDSGTDHSMVFAEIERRLAKEADEQLIEKKRLAMAESELAKKEVELERVRAEEDRKTIEAELHQEKALLLYEEELARARMAYNQALATQNMEKSLALERELLLKKEEIRKEIASLLQEKRLFYERQLEEHKQQNEKDKILAEIRARSEQERLNEDVTIRKLQAQSRVDTEKMVHGIKTVSQQLSRLVVDIISRPQQLAAVAGVLFVVLAVYYAIRELTTIMRQFVQARLGRPSLVRETSRLSVFMLDYWITSAASRAQDSVVGLAEHFKNVILSEDDKDRVIQLALTTRNTKRTGAPFRHVLLYGPPGTGKTLIARKLAECSNMDYAVMSGGDVGPLGEDAVNQLHSLFNWAAGSKKGLLLFIDEAEAFLSSRNNSGEDTGPTESTSIHIRHALNALLYQTGTQSTTFMLVLATNRPEDLDTAVLDRVDVSHFIGLPAPLQRTDLVKLYYKLHVPNKSSSADMMTLSNEFSTILSEKLDGFSGREISKLFIAVKYAVMLAGSTGGDVNVKNIVDTVVEQKIREHLQKQGFQM